MSTFTNKPPSVHESLIQEPSLATSLGLSQQRADDRFNRRLDMIIEERADHISDLLTKVLMEGGNLSMVA